MKLICDSEPTDISARKIRNKKAIRINFGKAVALELDYGQALQLKELLDRVI